MKLVSFQIFSISMYHYVRTIRNLFLLRTTRYDMIHNRTADGLDSKFISLHSKMIPQEIHWSLPMFHELNISATKCPREKTWVSMVQGTREDYFLLMNKMERSRHISKISTLEPQPLLFCHMLLNWVRKNGSFDLRTDSAEEGSDLEGTGSCVNQSPYTLLISRDEPNWEVTGTAELMEILKAHIVEDGTWEDEERPRSEEDRVFRRIKTEADLKMNEWCNLWYLQYFDHHLRKLAPNIFQIFQNFWLNWLT